MSTLVQAHRQVWLAQTPLTETCQRTLCSVPVEPGEIFGSAALEVLQHTVQARQTRQQLFGLHRSMPPPCVFQLPPGAALSHRLSPVAALGLSDRFNSLLNQGLRAFKPLNGCRLDKLRPLTLTVVPPGPPVSCFSQQQLS